MSALKSISKFRLLSLVTASILYPVVLRGLISVMHPKEGELVRFTVWLFETTSRDWIIEFVSAPTYSFLTSKVWSNPIGFFALWTVWIFIAFFFIIYKSKTGKYA